MYLSRGLAMSQSPTHEPVQSLLIQFLQWLSAEPRTYADVMDAWKSSCPRHPVFEDALVEGLIQIEEGSTIDGRRVKLTDRGDAVLASKKDV